MYRGWRSWQSNRPLARKADELTAINPHLPVLPGTVYISGPGKIGITKAAHISLFYGTHIYEDKHFCSAMIRQVYGSLPSPGRHLRHLTSTPPKEGGIRLDLVDSSAGTIPVG